MLIIPLSSFSQEPSIEFTKIIENNDFSFQEKEIKFDSLLNYFTLKKDYESLLVDRYEIAKWYVKQGHVNQLIKLNTLNVVLIDSLGIINKALLKKNLYSLGYYQEKYKKYPDAIKSFTRHTKVDTIDIYTFRAHSAIARINGKLNDFYLGAKQHDFASKFAKRHGNIRYYIENCLEAAVLYKHISTSKSIEKGINILNEAIQYSKNKPDNVTDLQRGAMYNHLANLYSDRKDFDLKKSKANYDLSIYYTLKTKDSIALADVYQDLGFLYLHTMQPEALTSFDKALTYNPEATTKSTLYRNKSIYYLNNNNKEQALINIQKSIQNLVGFDASKLKNLPKRNALYKSSYKDILLDRLYNKSEIWITLVDQEPFKESSYKNALKTLQLADYLVDIIRLESNEQQSKLFWREAASEIYINATKACYALNLHEEAFYFMEKSKALLLLEDINRKQLLENTSIPENITKQQIELKKNVEKFSNSKSNTLESEKQLLEAKQNYNIFIASLQSDYKRYYKVLEPASVISLKDFQATIKDSEVFLQYILDNTSGFGLLISNNSTSFFEIQDISNLKVLAKTFRALLGQPVQNKEGITTLNKTSLNLYNILIPKQIRGNLENKTLTIIPDSFIQNIPFEALQISEKPNSFLLLDNEINYAYSISFLKENNKVTRNNDDPFIGFAPIKFNNDLSDLPRSENELKKVSNLYNSTLFLNKEASIANFSSHIINHDIIHVASHANANDSISPWIAFSDNKINLKELYTIDNTAELVVLSACNTSLGEIYKGEGVMSLSRSFFNTGANSVLPSLWNVNDKSTAFIMIHFYKNLKAGMTKSSALHQAKLKYLNTHSLSETSPYYWASFVLIGNSDSIDVTKSNNILIVCLFILATVLLLGLYYYKTKK